MKKAILFYLNISIILAVCFTENVTVIGNNGYKKEYFFEKSSIEIKLEKTIPEIYFIQGLEQFPNLKKIIIAFSDLRKTDFSFLKILPSLQYFELQFATIENFCFLEDLPQIIFFSSNETILIEDATIIDLSQNKKLEFFEIHGTKLSLLPKFKNIPSTLKYISFSGVSFSKISNEILTEYEKINVDFFFNLATKEKISEFKPNLNLGTSYELGELYKKYSLSGKS